MEYTIDPEAYSVNLSEGAHESPDEGMCVMEWLSFLANEQFSDRPVCVSPLIGLMGRGLNDGLPPDRRQALKAISVDALGTAGDGFDSVRSCMATDWLVRWFAPTVLDLIPSGDEMAGKLRHLDRVDNRGALDRAGEAVLELNDYCSANSGSGSGMGEFSFPSFPSNAARTILFAASPATAVSNLHGYALNTMGTRFIGTNSLPRVLKHEMARRTREFGVGRVRHSVVDPTVARVQDSVIDLYAEMIKSPWVLDAG